MAATDAAVAVLQYPWTRSRGKRRRSPFRKLSHKKKPGIRPASFCVRLDAAGPAGQCSCVSLWGGSSIPVVMTRARPATAVWDRALRLSRKPPARPRV